MNACERVLRLCKHAEADRNAALRTWFFRSATAWGKEFVRRWVAYWLLYL
jgi:hypothetical protein